MPWIIRLNWYDSLSARPFVMMVDDTRFASWQITQASTVLRAPPWNALISVLEPDVVPSAPWQALHLSLATITRRGDQRAAQRNVLEGVLHDGVDQRARHRFRPRIGRPLDLQLGLLDLAGVTTRAVPAATAVAVSGGNEICAV